MQTEAKREVDSLEKQGCTGLVANQYVTKRPAMLQWLQRVSDMEGAWHKTDPCLKGGVKAQRSREKEG